MSLRIRHPLLTRREVKIILTCSIGAAAAVLSYEHGLEVTRLAGTPSWLAYLVPLLPDGLIGLSSAELYDAAQDGAGRPVPAITGLVLGIAVTIVMNVASGWHHGWPGRLLNALAPVALIVAVWVLEVGFRRARTAVAAISERMPCVHQVPAIATQQERAVAIWQHLAECQGTKPSFREVGRQLGIHHKIAGDLLKPVLNGDGT